MNSALQSMSPAVRRWFSATFPSTTEVQERGWAAIGSGAHVLLCAPTGSGKTLAAFLWSLDRLITTPSSTLGYRIIYVSPIKALAYDVERNLRVPLAGISREEAAAGRTPPPLAIDVRTGDTPVAERRQKARRPGDVLITTPESLYLLLGSHARWTLATAEVLIVDEIHALAPNKRGAHLALSIERLCALVASTGRAEPQRVGLSATQRPLEVVARYLGGDRAVSIVDAHRTPALDLQVVAPAADMAAPSAPDEVAALPPSERAGLWGAIYPLLLRLVLEHRSTIVFVNSRRLAERVAQQLVELARAAGVEGADELVRAHHGSLSRAEREGIERSLKAGALRAITATSSLELGIDMGAVDLVVQLESPGSVARAVQRIGRANHQVGGMPCGRLIPKFRGDLLELAALTAAMRRGELEPIALVEGCLDVLCQQIVAMCAVEDCRVDELARLVRRTAAFSTLGDASLAAVLDLLSGRTGSDELASLRPRLTWDRDAGTLHARRGARLLAVTNAGTIADRGLYAVTLGEGGPRVGELDEEMVYESRVGDTFLLGASTWRIEAITRDRVVVSPAPGEPGRMPFWRGDRPGRPAALGHAIGALCREIAAALDEGTQAPLLARLGAERALDEAAARNLVTYVDEQRRTGALPTDREVIIERFRDELGDFRVCILCPLGERVLAPWAMVLSRALSDRLGYPVAVSHCDDGISLRLPDGDALPEPAELVPDPELLEEQLVAELAQTSLFAGHFRENATRALLLPRRRPGQRSPLWAQRLRAQQLLGVARHLPSFPIVLETYRECLRDVFDLPSLLAVLRQLRDGTVALRSIETAAPSPFCRALAFDYVAAYLYQGDAPPAERRAAHLALDTALLRELLGERELRAVLDPAAIERAVAESTGAAPARRARDLDELADNLRRVGEQTRDELAARYAHPDAVDAALAELVQRRRAAALLLGGARRYVAIEDAPRYRDALGVPLPDGVPAELAAPTPAVEALAGLLARYARHRGPFLPATAAAHFGVSTGAIEAATAPLVARGALLVGAFLPQGVGQELCDADMLRRIRQLSLASARAASAAVAPARYAAFLAGWQGLTPPSGRPPTGLGALRAALGQLEGLALPWRDLEAVILPARVGDYAPRMLDELGASGELVWVGRAALGADDGRVVLCRREHAAHWLPPDDSATAPEALSELHRALLAHLRDAGASFLVALQDAAPAGFDHASVGRALWDLVWRGLVTNDTFAPLRSLGVRPGRRAAPATTFGGRWSLVAQLVPPHRRADEPARALAAHALARARAALARWGVVGRAMAEVETAPFAPVLDVLDGMDDVGATTRGFFVEGLGGVQHASAGALDALRGAPATSRTALALATLDPANPWGGLFAWPQGPTDAAKPARRAGTFVVQVGGQCVLFVDPRGKHMLAFSDDAALLEPAITTGLVAVARRTRRRRLTLERIATALAPGALAEWLGRAGARRDYRGWVIEAR